MKKILLLLFVTSLSFAYYAKLEPIETYSISSSVSGSVIYIDRENEGKYLKEDKVILKIDDFNEREELLNVQKSLNLQQKNLKNQLEIQKLEQNQYNRVLKLSSKSKRERELVLNSLLKTKNQTLSLRNNIESLILRKKILQNTINKKSITAKKQDFIYNYHVNIDDYVVSSTPLVDIMDMGYSKLEFFVSSSDKKRLADGAKILINDKQANIIEYKVWDIADSINISSFKVSIKTDLKEFSKLYKITIED
ncbi:MAG: Unknown protein [uncultured Campylobacterales bacterium]|uniref:HlyD family secretion protein n=1 Tax=uncultured Campylobacterales bacterium TaxID=352960 RepID=A0A6S6T6Z4_9BACT|nr:MAG: Unknown protein [uncultured Campylobacterales bacterium]